MKTLWLELTSVFPGGPGHRVGSVGGDLEEQTQKHSQHAETHVGLGELWNREVSSARHRDDEGEVNETKV